jgi:Spy/CpxP family protein refolding chaperone
MGSHLPVLHFFTARFRPNALGGHLTLCKAKAFNNQRGTTMAIRSKIFSSLTLVFAIGAFSVFATAQESTTTPQDGVKAEKGDRKFGKRGGKFGRGGMHGDRGGSGMRMGFLRGIELTDAQKAQIKAIHEANKPNPADFEAMKSIREARKGGGTITAEQKAEMKELRQARKAKREQVHQQILAVLTPEQKTQLEARKAEMQKRREEFRQKRQERIQAKPTDVN